MASRSSLELTREEAEGLVKAFKDEAFRELFAQYAAELADPAQRAIYEAEVAALERQRGVEARFLHPRPGWVLRTSQGGTRRCYVNICSNALVGRPEARPEPGGTCWSLPHCLAPGREELGRRRRRRLVYDVLFHPDTLRLAARCARFRRLVDDTALEALERRFSPGLDRANAVPLRGGVKYKGVPQATLLRTPLHRGEGAPPPCPEQPEDDEDCPSPLPPCPTPYAYPPPEPVLHTRPAEPPPAAATTPRWTLRHRSYVDLQDYRDSRDAAPSPVPRELVVSVELPLLSSAAQAQLEVRGRELQLDSQRPAAYRLRLPLPYAVDEARGRATFNKATRQLVVTLPVLAPPRPEAEPPAAAASGGGQATPEDEEEDPPPPSTCETPPPTERAPTAEAAAEESADGSRKTDPAESAPPAASHVGEPRCAAERAPAALAAAPSSVPGLPPPPAIDAGNSAAEPPAWGEEAIPGADKGECGEKTAGSPQVPLGSSDLALLPLGGTGSASLSPGYTVAGAAAVEEPCPELEVSDCAGRPSGAAPPCPDGPMPACHHPPWPEAASSCCRACSSADQSLEGSPEGRDPPVVAPPDPPTSTDPERPAPSLPSARGLPSPGQGAPPSSSGGPDELPEPAAAIPARRLSCPPFRCTQDEQSVTVLLQVPHVLPETLRGEVAPNGYTLTFTSTDAAAFYGLCLEFPPEYKLAARETEVSISSGNAVITLAKAPESAGLWTKLYAGPKDGPLQERLFITEDNVDGFLDRLLSAPQPSQPEAEAQPLIEVLDISEDQSLIRLKAHSSAEADKTGGSAEQQRQDGGELPPEAESCSVQTNAASGSRTAAETMGQAGGGPVHCLEPDPCDRGPASPGKEFRDGEAARTTGGRTAPAAEARLHCGETVQGGEGRDAPAESAQSAEGWRSPPAPPVLRETDMRDGSVRFISHHATRCAVTFQNTLLYELD